LLSYTTAIYAAVCFLATYFSLKYMTNTVEETNEFGDSLPTGPNLTDQEMQTSINSEDGDFKSFSSLKKSTRELISLIQEIPFKKLAAKYRDLKAMIRLPMLALVCACALQSSLNQVELKIFSVLLSSGTLSESLMFTALVAISIPISLVLEIHLVNVAMKYYEQIQVMTVY